ncbi:hypothetical protein ACOJCM_09960 [Billgrantia sp. LNSP4103-1]|uniref:hypothetical protein n=1 Tax=Billgrantia sp. LNSP4103-1 TaxID=3410266 RepID=UPI00403F9221
MPIQIENYTADGPHSNVDPLLSQSGVYVILGRPQQTANWIVVDVGESQNVQERVANHDRKLCWGGQGHSQLAVAAIYADQQNRVLIEKQLRQRFNPPCGLI